MTIEETTEIINIISGEYPEYFTDMGDKLLQGKTVIWAEQFKNMPFRIVRAAVMRYISTSTTPYAPKVGQIKDIIRRSITKYDPAEQWDQIEFIVRDCTENWITYAKEHLDEIALSIVGISDLQRLKSSSGGLERLEPKFFKEYEEKSRKLENAALETGRLEAIAEPAKMKQIGTLVSKA